MAAGAAPLWSHDGRELFYLSAGKDMMAARVSTGTSTSVTRSVTLFHVPDELLGVDYLFYTPWDVAADGPGSFWRVCVAGKAPGPRSLLRRTG